MATIPSGHTYPVDGPHPSSIMPGNHAELDRKVTLSDGACVGGAIFGSSIEVEAGTVEVKESLYAPTDIKVTLNANGVCNLCSAVMARKSLLVKSHKSGRLRIGGLVWAGDARLENTFIYGSLVARRLWLTNCVVLGDVIVSDSLESTGSLMGTFKAGRATLSGKNALWQPCAAAREQLSLRGSLLCHPLREYERGHSDIGLCDNDVRSVSYTHGETGEKETLNVISLSSRVQDPERIAAMLQESQKEHLRLCSLMKDGRFAELATAEDSVSAALRG